jgi:hypothetical protein
VCQSQIGPDELEIVDLTEFGSFKAQIEHLRGVWSEEREAERQEQGALSATRRVRHASP